MNKDTKKQLDEALNKEFNESSIDDYGIPADAIRISREIVEKAKELTNIMSSTDFTTSFASRADVDSYQSIKFVMANENLIKMVDAIQSVNTILNMEKSDIDEACEAKNMTLAELENVVLSTCLLKRMFGKKD